MPGRVWRCTVPAVVLVVRLRAPCAVRRGPAPSSATGFMNQGTNDLEATRRLLKERRDSTRARVDDLAKTPEIGSAQGFGKRIGDGTVEAISRLTEIGVGSALEETLARTERALAKLDEGTYGVCDACGGEI